MKRLSRSIRGKVNTTQIPLSDLFILFHQETIPLIVSVNEALLGGGGGFFMSPV